MIFLFIPKRTIITYDRTPFTPIGLRAISDGCAVSGGVFASGECAAQKAYLGLHAPEMKRYASLAFAAL